MSMSLRPTRTYLVSYPAIQGSIAKNLTFRSASVTCVNRDQFLDLFRSYGGDRSNAARCLALALDTSEWIPASKALAIAAEHSEGLFNVVTENHKKFEGFLDAIKSSTEINPILKEVVQPTGGSVRYVESASIDGFRVRYVVDKGCRVYFSLYDLEAFAPCPVESIGEEVSLFYFEPADYFVSVELAWTLASLMGSTMAQSLLTVEARVKSRLCSVYVLKVGDRDVDAWIYNGKAYLSIDDLAAVVGLEHDEWTRQSSLIDSDVYSAYDQWSDKWIPLPLALHIIDPFPVVYEQVLAQFTQIVFTEGGSYGSTR